MEVGKSVVWNGETLIIRKYDPAKDEQKVLELWQAAFDNQMSSSLWRWKYIENPYKIAIMLCENSKGMPVVFYGGIPFAAKCREIDIRMIHLCDIMSHPKYRGSGLFIHTANAYFDTFGSMDDVCIMYGFPGKFHFDIGAKYLKYSHLGNGAAFFRADIRKVKSSKNPISGIIELCDASAQCSEKMTHCFDKIWKNVSTDYPLSVIRDGDYIKWRYLSHPQKTYEVWRYRSSLHEEWQAFVVLQIIPIKDKIKSKTEAEKAVIVDMLIPDSENILCNFIGNIASMLIKRGISVIETWIPDGHFLSLLLLKYGFQRDKEPIGIIPTIRLFDDTLDMSWSCQNFYYTMGDGDLF